MALRAPGCADAEQLGAGLAGPRPGAPPNHASIRDRTVRRLPEVGHRLAVGELAHDRSPQRGGG
jgi:hypothetical protein